MIWRQHRIRLRPRARGCHLVDDEIRAGAPGIAEVGIGTCQLFIQHTSAALALNENADPTVRSDLEGWLRRAVPDGDRAYTHTLEGPDDMPAHIKAVLIGASLNLPIADGRLALGTWQGVYLCEHREHGGSRNVIATIMGSPAS